MYFINKEESNLDPDPRQKSLTASKPNRIRNSAIRVSTYVYVQVLMYSRYRYFKVVIQSLVGTK